MSVLSQEQLVAAIDACLPQTQCQLCAYPGCRPYANAIVNQGERIDRCLPGGVATLREIATLVGQESSSYVEEMVQKQKSAAVAVIREDECIGCTKCIAACPVDAILGAAKLMHTIISDACTGCELCIPVCPMDCIDLINIAERETLEQKRFSQQSRVRYRQHVARLEKRHEQEQQSHQTAKLEQHNLNQTVSARQAAIAEVLLRVKAKKS